MRTISPWTTSNVKENLINRVNMYQGQEISPDPVFLEKAVDVVKDIIRYQRPGLLLVSGDRDKGKAVQTWEEAPRVGGFTKPSHNVESSA
jgi:hypothetical protein